MGFCGASPVKKCSSTFPRFKRPGTVRWMRVLKLSSKLLKLPKAYRPKMSARWENLQKPPHKSRSSFGCRVCGIVLTALLGAGCFGPLSQSGGRSEDGPIEGPPTVELHGVVAGLVGNAILLQNHSTEELRYAEIVVNETADGGGYRFSPGTIEGPSTKPYLIHVFRNAAGESLDPSAVKVSSFAVYADTPRGRGSWHGQYLQ